MFLGDRREQRELNFALEAECVDECDPFQTQTMPESLMGVMTKTLISALHSNIMLASTPTFEFTLAYEILNILESPRNIYPYINGSIFQISQICC